LIDFKAIRLTMKKQEEAARIKTRLSRILNFVSEHSKWKLMV